VKPKPRVLNKQTSQTGSANSQNNYDPSSLFTPAYLEMLKVRALKHVSYNI